MTVGDQVGRIVGAPAGHDRDAPERRGRGGGRALVLPPARRPPQPHRLRARRTSRRCATSTRRSRELEVVVCEDDEAIVDAIDERTLLVPISHVLFKTAEIQDVEPIIRRAHEVGAHVILDCYQSAGIVPLDLTALGVDFAVGGSVKWLCGGPGNGWLYVRPDLAERLEPTFIGWQAHESAVRLRGGDATSRPGSARFLTGTPNVPAHFAATAGYDLIEEIGVDRDPRELAAPDAAPDRPRGQRGLRGAQPAARRSGAAARSRSTCPDFPAVHRELTERQILCDFRPDAGIRLGPHYYTSDEELRHVVEQIEEILATGAHERHLGVLAQH